MCEVNHAEGHIHLLLSISPKINVSEIVGT